MKGLDQFLAVYPVFKGVFHFLDLMRSNKIAQPELYSPINELKEQILVLLLPIIERRKELKVRMQHASELF